MKQLFLKTQRASLNRLTLPLLVCALAFIPAQGQETPHHYGHAQTKKIRQSKPQKTYSCPMHPEVTSKSKGKCPKCKMDLHRDVLPNLILLRFSVGNIPCLAVRDLPIQKNRADR